MPRTKPSAADQQGAEKQLLKLRSLLGGLKDPCVPTCTCHKLPNALVKCVGLMRRLQHPAANAADHQVQQVTQQMPHMLPVMAVMLGCHDHKARHTTLEAFNK